MGVAHEQEPPYSGGGREISLKFEECVEVGD